MAEEPRLPTEVDAGAEAITRVAQDVVPALISRLAASELGELEVAQHGWRVRLRRDVSARAVPGDGRGRAAAGHTGQHAGHTGQHPGSHGPAHPSGTHAGSGHSAAANAASQAAAVSRSAVVRRAAVAPAVGYFAPREGLAKGQAVRSGDLLGAIDVLGVTQPVLAPTDGVVGRILASVGEAVEYGQELVRVDGMEPLVES